MNTTHLVMFFFGGASAVAEAEDVVAGCFAAGDVYLPGFQRGQVYKTGFAAGEAYKPGFHKGQVTCQ